ncbi:MAG TPA: response regulator transcription factor [Chloroflexota bacterium]|nr:response regulator transcription factor [Chloroflexota bacterium]
MQSRVLIADDHIVWRRGLKDVLEPQFQVVCEASEGNEAVEKALACKPDVVVMDIRMPGMDGIAAARRIKEAIPSTGVVMMSATDDDRDIYDSIQAGVSGYVVKDEAPERMVEAVANAAEGKAYLPPMIAKRVLQEVAASMNGNRDSLGKNVTPLSAREISVLRLVAEGKRHKDIARELSISDRTVGNHVNNIYSKLGIEDRAQAIVYAIKKGIVHM